MRRRKDLPLLEKVKVTDIGYEGNSVARVNDLVVFVPGLIPGDIVDIQVVRKKRNYFEGKVVRFQDYSSDRIEPRCIHFGKCGGCKWQHLPYNLQLHFKEKQVKDILTRIGKVDIPHIKPVIGASEVYNYRNKLEYTFSDKQWLTCKELSSDNEFAKDDAIGFHVPGFFDKVLDIRECHLQPEPSNAIRNLIRDYAHKNRLAFFNLKEPSGFLRNLVIRNSLDGKVMVILVFYYEDEKKRKGLLDFIKSKFPQIASLMFVINSKRNDCLADQRVMLYYGEDHLMEEMEGLRFRIGPKSFYQTNTKQALQLYNVAKSFAALTGKETVYDLYTGAGTIANFIAGSAKKVIGLEYLEEAVRDAAVNSALNNIKNTCFISGDIRFVLNRQLMLLHGKPDIIITDPPRAGMHQDVVKSILETSPTRIIYISCNPATQARDISLMSGQYEATMAQPVDMFPHTHHIENVVLLEKRRV